MTCDLDENQIRALFELMTTMVAAPSAPEWLSDACVELRARGLVTLRSITTYQRDAVSKCEVQAWEVTERGRLKFVLLMGTPHLKAALHKRCAVCDARVAFPCVVGPEHCGELRCAASMTPAKGAA